MREAYGVPAEVANKWAFAGATEMRELIAAYRRSGADRIVLSIMEPREVAWPRVAQALGRT